MKKFLLLICIAIHFCSSAQNSDNAFSKPLRDVITEIEKRFDVKIRYPEDLVKNKVLTYADWRFRPSFDETMKNIFSSQDITYAADGEKKYKLQAYQYHLKTPGEGKEQLAYFSTLYHDVKSWEKRKAELKTCMIAALRLSHIPAAPSSKPIITPVRKFDGYTVQNIAIETLPGVYVSGSLYKSTNAKGKMPIILNPDGHFARGRYRADCQYRCAAQARMGAMAFSYDLFGWDGESQLQVKPEDHRRALVQSIHALNATRILDYLLSLKDADPTRVAITGGSGGGSHTMLMTAIDDRITLSIPVVMTSSYHSGGCPCESGMGVHLCGNGTNNVEIAAMAAPRPQLIVSDGKDWTQHVPETEFPFLQKTYGFYGKTNMVKNVHLANEGHDYGPSKRKAMYDFVAQQFGLNINAADESKVTIEKEPALYVFGDKGERLPANAVKGFDAVTKVFDAAMGH